MGKDAPLYYGSPLGTLLNSIEVLQKASMSIIVAYLPLSILFVVRIL